ncbi:Pre-mRNA-splicing factor syf2 [Lipomyces japonicus]|uniref:Pre-mRNA-splicing factor syf2 n=1 Tax=Lipomyces japonicus TaxID=56871 RepID=UPI0034CDBFC5
MPPKKENRQEAKDRLEVAVNEIEEKQHEKENDEISGNDHDLEDEGVTSKDDKAEEITDVTTATATSNKATDINAKDRLEKFKQLKRKMHQSAADNKQELYAEFRRQKTDAAAVARLERKKADAEVELAKQESKEDGEDFERRRAWDWTIAESEKWDERVERKRQAKHDVLFADYSQSAHQAYERELREFKPDLEAYLDQKTKMLQKSGELVETENGQLIVIDKDNDFYRTTDSLDFADNKPPKAAVDRLAASIRKADQQRMKKRAKNKDEDDVTYINDKNKKFNEKLSRYYDKYTKEIRDSFERGTAL